LVTASGGHLCLLNAKTGELVREVGEHWPRVRQLAVSPDGKLLTTAGGKDEMVKLWTLMGEN
jgi:WD40 repeat protein